MSALAQHGLHLQLAYSVYARFWTGGIAVVCTSFCHAIIGGFTVCNMQRPPGQQGAPAAGMACVTLTVEHGVAHA